MIKSELSVNPAPLFSIITVCLNDKEGLVRTGRSVWEQTNSSFEWIVIDGASSDGTVEYLKKFENNECLWVSEPDGGLYDAMNKGIYIARGAYLIFLNSGDEFGSGDVLQKVADSFSDGAAPDFIYCDSKERRADGALVYKPARSHKHAWYGMFTHHQAMFYKRLELGELRYSSLYPIGADYAFTTQFLKRASNAQYVGVPVCIFERGGLSDKQMYKGEEDQFKIRRDIMNYSWAACVGVRLIHSLVRFGKKLSPRLHESIRFSSGK